MSYFPTQSKPSWLKTTLSSDINKSVIFLNTEGISAPEVPDGNGLTNHKEAEIIISLLEALIEVS